MYSLGNRITWYKNQNVEKNISEMIPHTLGLLPLSFPLQRQPMSPNPWYIPSKIFYHIPSAVCVHSVHIHMYAHYVYILKYT